MTVKIKEKNKNKTEKLDRKRKKEEKEKEKGKKRERKEQRRAEKEDRNKYISSSTLLTNNHEKTVADGIDKQPSCDEELTFTINESFAKKYEHTKKRQELAELERKYAANLEYSDSCTDSESEEEEDENATLLTPAIDAQILKTIAKIRAKDPEIYQSDAKFFDDKDFEENIANHSNNPKHKPVFLKDYHRERLLSGKYKDGDEENDEKEKKLLTHVQEQELLHEETRDAFQKAASGPASDGEDNDDGILIKKPKSKEEIQQEEQEYKEFILSNLAQHQYARDSMKEWLKLKDKPVDHKRESKKARSDDQFLMDYVLHRGWMDHSVSDSRQYNDIDENIDLDEDANAVEDMEDFERKFNFRYDQEGGQQLVTHSRSIEDSLRRSTNKRALKRQSLAERKAEEKKKRIEELKRLKNLKKEEMKSKLQQIQEVAGVNEMALEVDDIDGDFDPDAYDRKMQKMFGDQFYEKREKKKPVFEDDLQDIEEFYTENGKESSAIDGHDPIQNAIQSTSKCNRPSEKPKSYDEYLDEYYKLHYEDVNLKTRFKYRKVEPSTYGLSLDDILNANDQLLNEYVSLKKMAPYKPLNEQKAEERKLTKKKRIRMFHIKQREFEKLQKQQERNK